MKIIETPAKGEVATLATLKNIVRRAESLGMRDSAVVRTMNKVSFSGSGSFVKEISLENDDD